MSCPVDPTAWGKANRVRLYKGKRNVWVLARTIADNPDDILLYNTTLAVMTKWFEGYALDTLYAEASDAVDGIEVIATNSKRPLPKEADQRREQMQPVPLLEASKGVVYVTVAFNYRGFEDNMPWPVWGSPMSLLKSAKICPIDATWMLTQSVAEKRLIEAPEELSAIDKLRRRGALPGGSNPLADLANLVVFAKWGLIAYVGFQAYQFASPLISSARRSASRKKAA